jgi:hypothetical protein
VKFCNANHIFSTDSHVVNGDVFVWIFLLCVIVIKACFCTSAFELDGLVPDILNKVMYSVVQNNMGTAVPMPIFAILPCGWRMPMYSLNVFMQLPQKIVFAELDVYFIIYHLFYSAVCN